MNEHLISPERIIDCLNDGVYVCDRQRRIVFWSKAAERITGWKSDDLVKKFGSVVTFATVKLEAGDATSTH